MIASVKLSDLAPSPRVATVLSLLLVTVLEDPGRETEKDSLFEK